LERASVVNEAVDFSLLTGQNTKELGLIQQRKSTQSFDKSFSNWVLLKKGVSVRDANMEAYRIAKVIRDMNHSITTLRDANEAAAITLASDYAKSTKRHKLLAIEDWMEYRRASCGSIRIVALNVTGIISSLIAPAVDGPDASPMIPSRLL
jgi:hypothetical protein